MLISHRQWHTTIADDDDKWTQNVFKSVFGKAHNELTEEDFAKAFVQLVSKVNPDPSQRTFAKLVILSFIRTCN